ncbi:MAG TPA: hypothetical protein VIF15_03740 [Polyangiaceae bacterium]|jgi:hypothetical protein
MGTSSCLRQLAALVAALAATPLITGCVVQGEVVADADADVVVVDRPPPADRVEDGGPAPGAEYVWIRGHWLWSRGDWVWRPGHWEVRRDGHEWAPGHWQRRPRGWIWIEGHWKRI